jgi:hypothetical protein
MAELTPELKARYRRLAQIFMPRMLAVADRLYPEGNGFARFAHYTSADSALKIIRSKRLWMRDATAMADYREVQHGYDLLAKLFNEPGRRDALVAALDACAPGVAMEGLQAFDKNWQSLRRSAYIASLSEHHDIEDTYGRLSMWRAFGSAGVRVALVVKLPAFSGAAQAMLVIFSPVSYATEEEVADELTTVTEQIRANADFLRGLDPQLLRGMVFVKFLASVVTLKHEAFREEAEWRAFYTPFLGARAPVKIKHSIECFNGVPQQVYHLPMDGSEAPELAGLEFTQIFDRLIIGPTQYPVSVADACAEELDKAGVKDVASKIRISGIPLRT